MTAKSTQRPRRRHKERHLIGRTGWLRAAVLGANAGIGALIGHAV
jgi:VIT1/CCC1 family predicted Fe2+/Mn2+ transporter